MLTLISWNVDGLARLMPAGLAEVHEALGGPDLLCLQEVRIRPQDHGAVAAMRGALPGFRCAHALCDDPVNVRFRGGRAYGVATYVRASLTTETLPPPAWDREGRLVALALPSAGIVVGNVYAVNGTDKPYFDHERGAFDGDRHAFKRRFQASLVDYFSPQRDLGRSLIVAGDWNVSRTAADTHPRLRRAPPHALARAQLNDALMPQLDLVDAFRALHPDLRQYTWFNRRTPPGRLDAARVDFALVSRALMPRVVAATLEADPKLRFGSDHAPVRLVLDV